MSLLENDSGDDGEVRHKRFDYPAPSLPGVIDFFINDGVSDVQAALVEPDSPRDPSDEEAYSMLSTRAMPLELARRSHH
jgi:hypothetical protein